MPANRLIHSEPFSLSGGEVKSLSIAFVPPANPNTRSATITLLRGGPVYFRAVEGESPTSSDRPIELGDELDVIGSEDLRLLRIMTPVSANLEISYFGGGQQS